MSELRYTLLSDGPSDRALLPLLSWLLRTHGVERALQADWADLRRLRNPPTRLADRISRALDLYPCGLLFVHRDAERASCADRVAEIHGALRHVAGAQPVPPAVCVVPVRMQEAWLLFDEAALRTAAGNPLGRQPLALPRTADLEHLPDPKRILHDLIREASGLHGRRRKRVPVSFYAGRVAELIDDFAPLRALSAFQALEADIVEVVSREGWNRT